MLGDAFACDLKELIPPAEGHRLARASLDARRHFAFACARLAEVALAHLRRQHVVIFVCGDLEGAGHHAIAAADALPGVIHHRAAGFLGQGADDAGRDAGCVIAVETVVLDVDRRFAHRARRRRSAAGGEGVNDSVGVGHRPPALGENGRVVIGRQRTGLKAVLLLAFVFAEPAPHALGQVHQHTVGFGRQRGPVRRALCAGECLAGPAHTGGGSRHYASVLQYVTTSWLHGEAFVRRQSHVYICQQRTMEVAC